MRIPIKINRNALAKRMGLNLNRFNLGKYRPDLNCLSECCGSCCGIPGTGCCPRHKIPFTVYLHWTPPQIGTGAGYNFPNPIPLIWNPSLSVWISSCYFNGNNCSTGIVGTCLQADTPSGYAFFIFDTCVTEQTALGVNNCAPFNASTNPPFNFLTTWGTIGSPSCKCIGLQSDNCAAQLNNPIITSRR